MYEKNNCSARYTRNSSNERNDSAKVFLFVPETNYPRNETPRIKKITMFVGILATAFTIVAIIAVISSQMSSIVPSPEEDNLVIIGGYRYPNYLSDIEAVNLEDDNINCDPTDLPYKVAGHASVYTPVLDGILTCGGEDENNTFLSKCILQRKGNESNHFPALNSKRSDFSLNSISDTIYAIGGYPNKNTMETINLNTDKQWKQEELHFSLYLHCTVGLGNKIIVTGGQDENKNTLDTTWIYDVVSQTWSEGPKMNTKRWFHACFQDTETSTIYIAGGWDAQWRGLNSTEKWTLEENSWKPSANLPEAISRSSAVSSNTDEFIAYMTVGEPWRYSKNIYGLKRREKTWIKLNKTMKTRRYDLSLLNIPANQISGC